MEEVECYVCDVGISRLREGDPEGLAGLSKNNFYFSASTYFVDTCLVKLILIDQYRQYGACSA